MAVAPAGPRVGREASLKAAIADNSTVKAPAPSGRRAYDATKSLARRKCHGVVDTSRLPTVILTPADVSHRTNAQAILDAGRKRQPRIKHQFTDSACDRAALRGKAAFLDFVVEVACGIDTDPGFNVPPCGLVAKRMLGWITHWRRVVRDYERSVGVCGAMIRVVMGSLPLGRASHQPNSQSDSQSQQGTRSVFSPQSSWHLASMQYGCYESMDEIGEARATVELTGKLKNLGSNRYP